MKIPDFSLVYFTTDNTLLIVDTKKIKGTVFEREAKVKVQGYDAEIVAVDGIWL